MSTSPSSTRLRTTPAYRVRAGVVSNAAERIRRTRVASDCGSRVLSLRSMTRNMVRARRSRRAEEKYRREQHTGDRTTVKDEHERRIEQWNHHEQMNLRRIQQSGLPRHEESIEDSQRNHRDRGYQ